MTVPQDSLYFRMCGTRQYGFEDESGDYTSEDFDREPEGFKEAVIAIASLPWKTMPGKTLGSGP